MENTLIAVNRVWGAAFWLALGLVLSLAGHCPGQAGREPESGEDIVMLKNGQSLTGKVVTSVDRITVETRSGSRIVLNTADVCMVCATWQEAWEFQRDSTHIDDAKQLQSLLQWCLRNQRFGNAWEVIDRLQFTDLGRAQLDQLHRQVSLAEKAAEHAHAAAIAATSPPPVRQPETVPQNRMIDSSVQPTSFSGMAGGASSGSRPAVVPSGDLDRFMTSVPDREFAVWRKQIEPLLVRGCTNAGCHSAGSVSPRLTTMGGNDPIPLRMSQQNLYRTAELIVGDGLGTDRFLAAVSTAHGGSAAAPLALDSESFRQVSEWARRIGDSVPAGAFSGSEGGLGAPGSAVATLALPGSPGAASPVPATADPPRQAEMGTVAAKPLPRPAPGVPSIPDPDTLTEAFVPADEFDPAIFNRYLRNAPEETRREAAALGLPDLQPLIGREKSPQK